MTIEAQLADGRVLEFPDGTDPSVIQATVKRMVTATPAPEAEPKQSTIMGEAVKGGKQMLSSMRTGLGSIVSPEESAIAGVERSKQIDAEAGQGPSFEPVKKAYNERGILSALGEAGSQIPRALAGQGANLAAMAGGARLGATAGAAMGSAFPVVGTTIGGIAGGVLGAGAALLPQFMGSNVERQASEQMEQGKPVDINRTKAYSAAAGQALLEGTENALVLGKGLVKGVLGIKAATKEAESELLKAAQRSVTGTVARGVVKGAAIELPVEVGQQILERAQAGLSLTSPDAMREYGDTLYQTALVAGPIGGLASVAERSHAKSQLAENAPPPAKATPATPTAPATTPEAAPTPQAAAATPTPPAPLTREQLVQRIATLDAQPNSKARNSARKRAREALAALDAQTAAPETAAPKTPAAEAAPEPAAFVPETNADISARLNETTPETQDANTQLPEVQPTVRARGRKRGVAVPVQPTETAGAEVGSAAPTGAPEEPSGQRLVPTEQPVSTGVTSEVAQPSALADLRPIADLNTLPPLPNAPKAPDELFKPTTPVSETPSAPAAPIEPEATAPAPAPKVTPEAPAEPQRTEEEIRAEYTKRANDEVAVSPLGKSFAYLKTAKFADKEALRKYINKLVKEEVLFDATDIRKFISKPEATVEQAQAELKALVDAEHKDVLSDKLENYAAKASNKDFRAQAEENFTKRAAEADLKRAAEAEERRKAPRVEPGPEHAEAIEELNAKVNLYNTSDELVKAQRAAAQIAGIAENPLTPAAVRQHAQNLIDTELDAKDIEAGRKKANREGVLGSSARANETPLPPKVLDELKYGSLTRALKELGFQSKDPLAKAIAKRLSWLLDGTKVTIVDNLTYKDKAYAGLAAQDGSEIRLDSATGLNQEVLLHEAVHAATEHVLSKYHADWTPQQKVAVMELKSLWEAARSRPSITLSYDARNSLSEFVTEAMTNPDLQVQLRNAKWKSKTLWESFKHDILRLIGVTNPTNMLDYAVAAMDTIFDAPPQVATTASVKQYLGTVSPTVESLVNGAGDLSAPERSMFTSFLDAFKVVPGLDYVTKFRTQTADIAATIENRLREKFDGKVRNDLGEINPFPLYRQAQDISKMMLQFLQTGSIEKEAATSLWKVVAKEGTRAPAKVYDMLADWSKAQGYSFEQGKKVASRILEGVRLDRMRASNYTGATDFALHKIDKTSNLSVDQQINAMVAEYKRHPELQEMSKLMDEARIALVDHMVAVGRLTPEMGKEWKEVVGYVPFDRMEQFADNFSRVKRMGARGLAQVGKLPELKGSFERPVGDVFGNYMNTLGWMMRQVIHTDATVRTLNALQDIQMAKFYNTNPRSDHVVSAYVNGELKYWELPSKYDVMAFKDLNIPQARWIQNLGAFSNILRATVTALPPFAIKQVTDDVQRAIMTSGVKSPAALLRMALTNFPKLVYAELRGIEHPLVKQFGAYGLSGEYDFQQSKPADSLLKDMGYSKRSTFGALLHKLEGITRASDLAVRAAIYEQTLKESNNDVLLAQTRSREFINFRRRGASEAIGAMVTTIPFFNAYVQGMDVLYRAASGKEASASNGRALARRMFMTRALTVTFISSLYALSKSDDDEYKDMDLRTRDSNWIFPNGYKLSVPGEIGAVFKVIPERVVEYMRRQGTVEEQSAFEVVASTLSYMYEQYLGRVNPIPQAIKPVLEAWSNKSFLTGRALEGFHHGQMDPSMRRTENTSELAVAIANFARDELKMEVSPIMIDNTLRGYFGSTAALLTATTDAMLNPDKVDRPLHKWALFSNYMYDPIGTRKVTEFYEQRDKSMRATVTLKELMRTDMTKAAAYAESHMDELALESGVQSTLNQLEQTRAYRKFLNSPEGAKAMPREERESQLEEIKKMEVQLTSWVREARVALNAN